MRKIGGFIFILIILLVIIVINDPGVEREDAPLEIDLDDGYSALGCDEMQVDGYGEVNTTRSWIDYDQHDYCMQYTTDELTYKQAQTFRRNYVLNAAWDQDSFWGYTYRDLYNNDKASLAFLADSLWSLKEEYDLTRTEFADLIVSFVQDIPYSYILDEERCVDQSGEYFDCLQDENLGILTPLEFLHTLRGDCDTRTVLLYTIFKYFNYTPKIAVSWTYLHSMLLLDVPSNGKYLEHLGQKYYFWETTSTGWSSGEIPPDMGNTDNWKILLH